MEKKDTTGLISHSMRTVLDNTEDFMFVKDKDLLYVGASSAFAIDCVGCAGPEEIIGKTDFEIFSEKYLAEKYRKDDEHLMKSHEKVLQSREEYPGKNGEKRYCLTTKYLITDDKGNAAGIFGQFQDITEQVRMEQAEIEQKEKLERQARIFRAMQNVYNVVLFYDFKNDRYEHIVGEQYVTDQIKYSGKISQVLPTWMKYDLTPETREANRSFFELSTMCERLKQQGILTRELETLVFGWVRISLIPVDYDNDGNVISCLWVSEKIGKEIETRATLQNRLLILEALRNIYQVCMYWNLKNDSYFLVSGKTYEKESIVPEKGCLSSVVPNWLKDDIRAEDLESCQRFFAVHTMGERLKNGVIIREVDTVSTGWVRFSMVPISQDNEGNVESCLLIGERISEEKERELSQNERLIEAKKAAETDALTGLLNRGGSEYQISAFIEKGGSGLLCMLDVDNFKHINDAYGHAAGDVVLTVLAEKLRSSFRKTDIIARFGGDEFVVFAYAVDTVREAELFLQKLLTAVETESVPEVGEEGIQISVGAVLMDQCERSSFETIYQLCDNAMYQCKNGEIAYCIVSADGDVLKSGNHLFEKSGKAEKHLSSKNTNTLVQRSEDNKKIVDALNDVFYSSYYINLKEHSYRTIKSDAVSKEILSGSPKVEEAFGQFIEFLVDDGQANKIREFCDITTLTERLRNKKHIDIEYKNKIKKVWCQASFIPVDRDENGKVLHVLFMVSKLDAGKAREIEEGIHNKKRLMTLYEERLQALAGMNEKSLTIGRFNLTRNTYKAIRAEAEMDPYIDETKTFEELMMNAAGSVVGEGERTAYRKLFRRDNLLNLVASGQMHVRKEHLFRIDGHTEWLESVLDMVRNPVTGEVEGICYSKSIQDVRLSTLLLQKTLKQDYPIAVVIFADTDEYFLFDAQKGAYGECRHHYWDTIGVAMEPIVIGETAEELQQRFAKEKIVSCLDRGEDYSYIFDSDFGNVKQRTELKFSYLDDTHNLILAVLRNITDQILLDKLRHDGEHDPLTDLYNRKTVFKKCRKLLEEYPDEQFVMAHVDIRHFHLYNTFFGDEAGDQLLCDIADLFRYMDRDYEHWAYGRIEADVFCAFFPYDQNIYNKHMSFLLERVQNYREDFLIEPLIGLYFVGDKNLSMESMFTRATIASKNIQTGLSEMTVIYNDTMEQKLTEEQQIVNEMYSAVENEQFQVYLQPKYSLHTNKPVGAEALVRWKHPRKGMISPAQFIPVFEGNGFIVTLDRYMWEHVCRLLSKWQSEGMPMFPVSVNVSRISMFSQTTVQFLKDLVARYEIDPKYLQLELTESAYIDDPEEMKLQMAELRAAGFAILMDDFGSGYSSLNTLRELPVDCLKLDMKFLSNSENDFRGSIVLSSVVHMSELLNLFVIAEGVETQEQAAFLKSIGCEYVQGYLFAHPMPVEEYEMIITEK